LHQPMVESAEANAKRWTNTTDWQRAVSRSTQCFFWCTHTTFAFLFDELQPRISENDIVDNSNIVFTLHFVTISPIITEYIFIHNTLFIVLSRYLHKIDRFPQEIANIPRKKVLFSKACFWVRTFPKKRTTTFAVFAFSVFQQNHSIHLPQFSLSKAAIENVCHCLLKTHQHNIINLNCNRCISLIVSPHLDQQHAHQTSDHLRFS
jgi:hypothetical protein